MATLHIAHHLQDGTTRIYLLRSTTDSNRFHGLVVPFDDPSQNALLQLDMTLSNPDFPASVTADLAQGPVELQVQDSSGEVHTVTVRRTEEVVTFRASNGQTLIAASSEEDESSTPMAVGVVVAVAFVGATAILTIGAVAVVAMNGTFSGSASTGQGNTDVKVEASAEKPN
jgi:hypothetical protein